MCTMEINADVLYKGALAQYEVALNEDGLCSASLITYKGNMNQRPPDQINLRKEGRGWLSENVDGSLLDDLGHAIESKAKPILERRRDGYHPAS